MRSIQWGSALLGVLASVQLGCSNLQYTVIKEPVNTAALKAIGVGAVQVTSEEKNDSTRSANAELRGDTARALEARLRRARRFSAGGPATVQAKVHVAYGNAALRYFVGWGAGAGRVQVDLALVDAAGTVRYKTVSTAELEAGANSKYLARKAIDAAIKQFVSQI